jgi:hypothetical protein
MEAIIEERIEVRAGITYMFFYSTGPGQPPVFFT